MNPDPEPVPGIAPSGNSAESGDGQGGMRSGAEVVEPAPGTGSGSTAGSGTGSGSTAGSGTGSGPSGPSPDLFPWRAVGDGHWVRREPEAVLRVEPRHGARRSWGWVVFYRGALVANGSDRTGSFTARQKADRALVAHKDTRP